MKVTNVKSYIKSNVKSWKGPDNYLLWLYLSEIKEGIYRIVGHAYMQNDMFWDGSGINPLKVVPSKTKLDLIEQINEEIALRQMEV